MKIVGCIISLLFYIILWVLAIVGMLTLAVAVASIPALIVSCLWFYLVAPAMARIFSEPALTAMSYWETFGIWALIIFILGMIFKGKTIVNKTASIARR